MHTKPRKRFGQHFLIDAHIIEQIIQTINPQANQTLIEIGPGLGAITKPLLRLTKKLIVIELDRNVIPLLQMNCQNLGELEILNLDVLKFDFNSIASKTKLRIVGNLPYNISTPLMFHLFKYNSLITDMHFMVQKEVAARLAAAPNSKQYGRLSVMAQYHCEITELFDVSPQAFKPMPKVNSSIIVMRPKEKTLQKTQDYDKFEIIVREAFNHRRKTLHNCLKAYLSDTDFAKLNIEPTRRPETLTVKEFVALAKLVTLTGFGN